MRFHDIDYAVHGPLGIITLNVPQYKNAQSYRMLGRDRHRVRPGACGQSRPRRDRARQRRELLFPATISERRKGWSIAGGLGAAPGNETYDQFRKYNFDLLLKWRNFEKPTIAMVEGYCIYAGWMLAACCDIVFAAEDAQFLAGFVEYMSIPWDIGIRRAKELCFESRFVSAGEAASHGFVNRVLPTADLERETYAFARRVAENSPRRAALRQSPDEQGAGRAGLQPRRRRFLRRLCGDDERAR